MLTFTIHFTHTHTHTHTHNGEEQLEKGGGHIAFGLPTQNTV
jgi:hypothetical protein